MVISKAGAHISAAKHTRSYPTIAIEVHLISFDNSG